MNRTHSVGGLVLVVEDDPPTAETLVELLEAKGYTAHHVASAAAALAAARRVGPDLIVTDLILPDGDGLVLCSELKEVADAPILICSATQRKRDAVLGLKFCADDFLAKPFDPLEFQARVEALLRRDRRAAPRGVDARLEWVQWPHVENGHASMLAVAPPVSLALTVEHDTPSEISHDRTATGERSWPLTAREREVAALIARGLTNREIADALVISKLTVDKHVGNVLAKLSLTRRAQIAIWAIEHGLAPRHSS